MGHKIQLYGIFMASENAPYNLPPDLDGVFLWEFNGLQNS